MTNPNRNVFLLLRKHRHLGLSNAGLIVNLCRGGGTRHCRNPQKCHGCISTRDILWTLHYLAAADESVTDLCDLLLCSIAAPANMITYHPWLHIVWSEVAHSESVQKISSVFVSDSGLLGTKGRMETKSVLHPTHNQVHHRIGLGSSSHETENISSGRSCAA